MRRIFSSVLAVHFAMALAADAAVTESVAGVAQNVPRADYNFRSVAIEEVFDMLSRTGKVNIILTKGVTGNVTLTLYGATLKEAIIGVAQAAGFWVELRNGDYIVMGKDAGTEYPSVNTQIKTLKVQYSDTRQIADILAKYTSRYGRSRHSSAESSSSSKTCPATSSVSRDWPRHSTCNQSRS